MIIQLRVDRRKTHKSLLMNNIYIHPLIPRVIMPIRLEIQMKVVGLLTIGLSDIRTGQCLKCTYLQQLLVYNLDFALLLLSVRVSLLAHPYYTSPILDHPRGCSRTVIILGMCAGSVSTKMSHGSCTLEFFFI